MSTGPSRTCLVSIWLPFLCPGWFLLAPCCFPVCPGVPIWRRCLPRNTRGLGLWIQPDPCGSGPVPPANMRRGSSAPRRWCGTRARGRGPLPGYQAEVGLGFCWESREVPGEGAPMRFRVLGSTGPGFRPGFALVPGRDGGSPAVVWGLGSEICVSTAPRWESRAPVNRPVPGRPALLPGAGPPGRSGTR